MQISLLFDKAASVVLRESAFEEYSNLEIGDKLTEIEMPYFQPNLFDGKYIISNAYSLIHF
ncbi:hypothetical protein IWX83_000232 [Flavobacterium sp. CG_9.1]|nr:hypothetical protein [Flavobacterium sp. CG_9.1]